MKIAINTRFLMPSSLEGLGWFTHEVAKRWVAWYPEHEFIFIFDRAFSEEFIFADNVKGIVAFPPARHPILFYCWYEWSLPRILKREKVDLFLSPDGFLSLRSSVPTLMVLHDIAWKHFPKHIYYTARKFYAYYVPRYCRKAKKIATVSEYSKQDIITNFGINKDKIEVVYNGSQDSYRPLSVSQKKEVRVKYSDGQPYFLYVGSIHPRKNVANLLRAFDEFKQKTNSPIKMILVGRMAWQTGEIGDLLPQLSAQKDIIFLGYQPSEELPNIVGAAYAMTYISLFEGFGIPLLEAMYCDVPSITSETSSMPEVVGKAGLLVCPTDVAQIAEQMQNIWENKALYKALIAECRLQRKQFSWDLTAKKLWDSLCACLE